LTGQQSLEPSQSTEQQRRTVELEATWNLIDTALAISQSRTAEDEAAIAQSRYRKTVHNIHRDVYAAYWRALSFQRYAPEIDRHLTMAERQIAQLTSAQDNQLMDANLVSDKIRDLNQKREALLNLSEQGKQAFIELKALLSLPLEKNLVLEDQGDTLPEYKDLLTSDVMVLERQALTARPEMDEEIAKRNISWREARQEMLKTFPGLELFFSNQYDSNKFLNDPNWSSYSATLLQSLTNILNAPARMRQAENNIEIADVRRQALTLAIMAQTRLALYRMELAGELYKTTSDQTKVQQKSFKSADAKYKAGFLSGEGRLNVSLEALNSSLRKALAQADLHESYASLMVTLGRSVYDNQTTVGVL
jgi:outer membrane protein TolC